MGSLIPGFFGGFVGSTRDFFFFFFFGGGGRVDFCSSPSQNYLHHLKSGAPPGDFLGLLFHADLHFLVVKGYLVQLCKSHFLYLVHLLLGLLN